MADDTTTPAPGYDPATLQAMIARLQQDPPNIQPDTTPVARSWVSRIGEALGGGTQIPMSPADREAAGIRALGDFSTSLMENARYEPGKSVFTNLGRAFRGASEGLLGSQALAASNLAARQGYAQSQQEQQLARLKEALPLLKLQAGMNAPNVLAGATGPASVGVGANTYEGAIGGHEGTGTSAAGAVGTGQFLESTWQDFAAANPDLFKGMSQAEILAARNNPALGNQAITWLAQRNAGALGASGAPVSGQSLGIAHYVGPTAAASILAAPDSTPVSSFVGKAALDKNPELRTMTAGQMKARYANTPAPGFLATGKPVAPPAVAGAPPAVAPAQAPAPSRVSPDTTQPDVAPTGGQVAGPGVPPNLVAKPPGPNVTGDVGALMQGMINAGADPKTLLPPTVGTPGGSVPPASQVASTGPIVPPPVVPPTTTPPPPGKPTFEQFQAAHPLTVEPSSYAVTPPNLDALISSRNQAKLQLDRANAGLGGDPNKSLSDYNTAAKAVTDAQAAATTKSLELRQAAEKTAVDTQRQLYDAEMTRQQQAEIKAQELAQAAAEADKGRAHTLAVEQLKAGYTQRQAQADQAAKLAEETVVKPYGAAVIKGQEMNQQLEQMLPILKDLPKGGGAIATLLATRPDLMPLAHMAGVIDDKQANAVTLINGLVAGISADMKPAGLGAMREYEWNAFKARLPTMLSTTEGQQKAIAFLMNYNNRVADENSWVLKHYYRQVPDDTKPGTNATMPAHNLEPDSAWGEGLQQRMNRELGPVVPRYKGPASGQDAWANSLPPGKPYYRTWGVPDPAHPNPQDPQHWKRNSDGKQLTTTTMEVTPWQQ